MSKLPGWVNDKQESIVEQQEGHLRWNNQAIRGLTYLYTGRGPLKAWLFKIGKARSSNCGCEELQDTDHLHEGCGELRACSRDDMWKDERWCEDVFHFLRNGG